MSPSDDSPDGERLPFIDGAETEDGQCSHCGRPYDHQKTTWAPFVAIGILLCTFTAIVATAVTAQHYSTRSTDPSLRHYSPVNHLVEYVPRHFNRSRGDDKSSFQGWPTDEIDQEWASLYSPGIVSTIDGHSASQLPEKTERLPVPGREDEFVVTLDVFHQMHCLDVVRMALYRDRYDKHFYFPNGTVDYCKWLHVDHCLDQVRQALVCNADVSVVYYAWSDVVQGMRPRVDNQHTCRNYTKILHWASSRSIEAKDWHPSRRVIRNKDGSFRIQQGRNHALEGQGECNAV